MAIKKPTWWSAFFVFLFIACIRSSSHCHNAFIHAAFQAGRLVLVMQATLGIAINNWYRWMIGRSRCFFIIAFYCSVNALDIGTHHAALTVISRTALGVLTSTFTCLWWICQCLILLEQGSSLRKRRNMLVLDLFVKVFAWFQRMHCLK